MSKPLSEEALKFIIGRLVENANEAVIECENDKSDLFSQGRRLAYYEMLDILKSELDVREQDLAELGLNIDLEHEIA